jgi:hypothetical protein
LTDTAGCISIGYFTMKGSATTTNYATCVGWAAGTNLAGGHNATLIGEQAGTALTNGQNNTMVGSSAGKATTTGGSNAYFGRASANAMVDGGFNTALGHAALFQFTTGTGNVAVGNQSLNAQGASTPTTGDYNIGVGHLCGPTVTGVSGTICIGSGATAAASATVSAANTGKIGFGQTDFTISGNLFFSTADSALANASGQTLTVAQLLGGTLDRSGAAGVSDTTPTAAAIVAAIPGCEVGTSRYLCIINRNTGTLTILAGSNVTLAGTTTIATVNSRWYLIRVTNVGTPAVTMRGLMVAPN